MAKVKGFNAKWNEFYSAFSEALLDCGHQFTKQGETMLLNACEEWLEKQDRDWMADQTSRLRFITDPKSGRTVASEAQGGHNHPWFTGTLHDSISTRVADGNRTVGVRYMPNGGKSDDQFAMDPKYYPLINGAAFGRLMSGRASRVKQNAVVAQVFIGVPYAQIVDQMPEHEGFIREMEVSFISAMEDVFSEQKIKNLIIRPRK